MQEEMAISGILFHPEHNVKDDKHTHDMYLVTWDGRIIHVHNFTGVTSVDVGHRHRYAGTTEPAPSGVPHTHGYYTVTSLDDGHTHVIRGTTGPDVPLRSGGHYHVFVGSTTVNGATPHTHRYTGRTTAAT